MKRCRQNLHLVSLGDGAFIFPTGRDSGLAHKRELLRPRAQSPARGKLLHHFLYQRSAMILTSFSSAASSERGAPPLFNVLIPSTSCGVTRCSHLPRRGPSSIAISRSVARTVREWEAAVRARSRSAFNTHRPIGSRNNTACAQLLSTQRLKCSS